MLERRIQEVTKANQKFYEAFESLDIAKMDEVWAHLDYVTCVHPGWTLRSDWPSVGWVFHQPPPSSVASNGSRGRPRLPDRIPIPSDAFRNSSHPAKVDAHCKYNESLYC